MESAAVVKEVPENQTENKHLQRKFEAGVTWEVGQAQEPQVDGGHVI
jgi:hypothetical protein